MSALINHGHHEDPLYDVALEEAILSTMMNGALVKSPGLDAFTSPFRKRLYELLRQSTPFPQLEVRLRAEGYLEDELAYITDVWLVPAIHPRAMLDAVLDLTRLAQRRKLCAAVDEWRRRAPTRDFDKAVKELGAALRGNGRYRHHEP